MKKRAKKPPSEMENLLKASITGARKKRLEQRLLRKVKKEKQEKAKARLLTIRLGDGNGITLLRVEHSTSISGIGYNPETKEMAIWFTNNRLYKYFDISPARFSWLRRHKHIGRAFASLNLIHYERIL